MIEKKQRKKVERKKQKQKKHTKESKQTDEREIIHNNEGNKAIPDRTDEVTQREPSVAFEHFCKRLDHKCKHATRRRANLMHGGERRGQRTKRMKTNKNEEAVAKRKNRKQKVSSKREEQGTKCKKKNGMK